MLHLFRDGQSDVFALTRDRSGRNLPAAQDSDWSFLETLDPVRLAETVATLLRARLSDLPARA